MVGKPPDPFFVGYFVIEGKGYQFVLCKTTKVNAVVQISKSKECGLLILRVQLTITPDPQKNMTSFYAR